MTDRYEGALRPVLHRAAPGAAFAVMLTVLALALAMGDPARASEGHGSTGGHHPSATIGAAAPAAAATRTVEIALVDTAYSPATVTVEGGETVRFLVTNRGTLVHEFNIGTPAMHAAHRTEMMEMVNDGLLEADRIRHDRMAAGHGMAHADPNSVLLEPGQSGEVVWTFPQSATLESGTLEIACNVPGHYEAGMKGAIAIH